MSDNQITDKLVDEVTEYILDHIDNLAGRNDVDEDQLAMRVANEIIAQRELFVICPPNDSTEDN